MPAVKNTGSSIEVETVKEVSQSYLTSLWNDVAFDKKQTAIISSLASKMSNWFTPVIIFIALLASLFLVSPGFA